jgi:hypothetical protein
MKRIKLAIPVLIGMLLFGAFVNLSGVQVIREAGLFMAWASATATATATATPTPVAVKINPNQGITHFYFTGTNRQLGSSASNIYGGFTVYLKATAALVLGQAVIPDASNADSVVVATAQTASHVIGVVVGSRSTATSSDKIGVPPGAGQIAIVQVSGVTQMIADGTITIGDTVIVSSAVVGGVADGAAAGTVSADTIGVALSTGAAGAVLDVLLETPRNF